MQGWDRKPHPKGHRLAKWGVWVMTNDDPEGDFAITRTHKYWIRFLAHHWFFLILKLELSDNLTIAPLQRFACSKKTKFLKILSRKVILTSNKGHNYVTNLRTMTANIPNVDLVSINSYIKFGQN